MNRQELIDQIKQGRQRQEEDQAKSVQKMHELHNHDMTLGHIADMLDGLAELITTNTQKVRVLNHPKDHTIHGVVSIQEADLLIGSLDDLENAFVKALDDAKDQLVEAINEEKQVTVTNQQEFPSIEIPDKVQANILTMPKYVSEGFEKLYKAIKALDLQVNVAPTPVSVQEPDLSPLLTRLAALETLLQSILEKEVVELEQPDFTPVNDILGRIEETMKGVESNTGVQTSQTFRASWDKSFEMKSKDMDTTFHYTNHASGRKVTNYIEVIDEYGDTYRRTFTFDTDGDVATATKWTKQ